ncbi:hypothetical protein ACFLT7_06000 [candidate division KSB1 bacterium]
MIPLPANIDTYRKRTGYRPRIFVEIAGSSQFYGLKTETVDSVSYKGILESVSPISQTVNRLGGLASVSNFQFSVLNQNLESDTVLSSYPNIINNEVKVYLGFDSSTGALPASSTGLLQLWQGRIDHWTAGRDRFTFECVDSSLVKDRTIPINNFNSATFPNAADEIAGDPVPCCYGEWSYDAGADDLERQNLLAKVVPMKLADQGDVKYVVSDFAANQFNTADQKVFLYFSAIKQLAYIGSVGNLTMNPADSYQGKTRTTLQVQNDLQCSAYIWGGMVDADLDVGVSNPEKALNKDLTDDVLLTDPNDVLAVRLNGPSKLGPRVVNFQIAAYVEANTAPGFRWGYYRHGSDSPAWRSTGAGSTWSSALETGTGWQTLSMKSTEADRNWDDWPFGDLSIGLKSTGAGDIRISALIIYLQWVPDIDLRRYEIVPAQAAAPPRSGSLPSLFSLQPYAEHKIGLLPSGLDKFGTIYAEAKGGKDNSTGGITGSANALLQTPPHILEHMLWQELGWTPGADYNSASFDNAADRLSSYKMAFILDKSESLLGFIDRLGKQSKSQFYWDNQDRLKISAHSSDPNFTAGSSDAPAADDIFSHDPTRLGSGSTATYRENPILENTFIYDQTHLDALANSFRFNYAKSNVTGAFHGATFVNSTDNNLSIGGSTYQNICSTSIQKYLVNTEFNLDCDLIKDPDTVEDLLKFHADQLAEPKKIVSFRTGLKAIGHELTDVINVRHPLINAVVSDSTAKKWQIIGKTFYPPTIGDPQSASVGLMVVEI